MSNWLERPGESWINLDLIEKIEIKPFRGGGESDDEWDANPFWEVVAQMPSGNVELLTLDNKLDRLIEWVRNHTQ